MFLPLQALLILSIVTKINGHKDDIEARIYMDRIHPTPTPSVKENFEASVVKVKKMVQKGAAIAIAMMEQYADFMRDQECQPICQGLKVIPKQSDVQRKRAVSGACHGLMFEPSLSTCCRCHTICYKTCGSEKKDCDEEFHSCLEHVCQNIFPPSLRQVCHGLKGYIEAGTYSMSCKRFHQTQQSFCQCLKDEL